MLLRDPSLCRKQRNIKSDLALLPGDVLPVIVMVINIRIAARAKPNNLIFYPVQAFD